MTGNRVRAWIFGLIIAATALFVLGSNAWALMQMASQ